MQECKIASFKWILTFEVENPKMFWNFETKFGEYKFVQIGLSLYLLERSSKVKFLNGYIFKFMDIYLIWKSQTQVMTNLHLEFKVTSLI
jgi:hypothetical protein